MKILSTDMSLVLWMEILTLLLDDLIFKKPEDLRQKGGEVSGNCAGSPCIGRAVIIQKADVKQT